MIVQIILDVLFPPRCLFCDRLCRQKVCEVCRGKLEYIGEPRCSRCGKPIRYNEQELCYDCTDKKRYFETGRSLWLHRDMVSDALYRFKYHYRSADAEYYGEELARQYGSQIRRWQIEQIIPVPLHSRRYRSRGFNQAEKIAETLGAVMGISVSKKAVCRQRATIPQKELSSSERRRNLQGAFRVARNARLQDHVLVIDDIYTTGSTIDEMAKVLKKSGVRKVYFLTISIGQGI